MKKFIAFAAVSAVMLTASAQSVVNNPDNRLYWGIRAGVDVNYPSNWKFDNGNSVKMFRSGAGGSVGAYVNVPIVANLFVEPGIGLFYDTYRYDDLQFIDADGNLIVSDPQVRKFGFRVPVMLGYRFDFTPRASVSLFTGPELNYSAWGEVGVPDKELSRLFSDKGQRRVNIAWAAGVSLEWDYHWVLSLGGSFGLNDLQHNNARFRENRLTLRLGYNF